MKTYIIYSLSSSDNPEQVRYIGQTVKKLSDRLIMHLSKAKTEKNHRACWIRKELKLGHKILITELDQATDIDWAEKEKRYIKLFKALGAKLVNTSLGGETTTLGVKHTQATKDKMSKTRTGMVGRVHSEETKARIKAKALEQFRLKGHPRKGLKHSEESKTLISKAAIRQHKTKQ